MASENEAHEHLCLILYSKKLEKWIIYRTFVVATGFEVWTNELGEDLDDYNSIMRQKALADHFAEAFAEYLHEKNP
jgi:cobalamin-dependent methionine synthase I